MPKRQDNSYAKCGINDNERSQSKSKFTEQNNMKYLKIDLKKGSVNAQNIKVNKILI